MKKYAIITICDNNNYGNRLQNYALHKILSNFGLDNVTLWDEKENTLKAQIKLAIKKVLPTSNINRKKYIAFQKFTRKNIANKYVSMSNLKEINNKFDYFIVGSDQIWNYNFGHAQNIFLVC